MRLRGDVGVQGGGGGGVRVGQGKELKNTCTGSCGGGVRAWRVGS